MPLPVSQAAPLSSLPFFLSSVSFLALDAGNSSVKAAMWDGAWGPIHRLSPADHTEAAWRKLLTDVAPGAAQAGIASVRPALTPTLAAAVRSITGAEPHIVSAEQPLPFRLAYQTPTTLGTDRLAAAVAAHALAGGSAVIALDAGTAITTEVVSEEPAYLGGAILPGPALLRQSLARDTDQLPDVPWPETLVPIGGSTVTAIQAGLGVLLLDGIAGLLSRTKQEVGNDALIVATGGWAPWLADRLPEIDRLEPHLVLDGVRRLAG